MPSSPFLGRYEEICRAVEEEFSRNRRLHGERIQCRSGCSSCCGQLFQITELEAAAISAAVAALDASFRSELQREARQYLAARRQLVASLHDGEPEAWGSLPPPGTRLACPALSSQGACRIYEARPLICRKFGIPLYNPDRPGRVFACELNFRPGEPIEDGQLVQIQTGIHAAWKQTQNSYNRAGLWRDEAPISVARAILEDFRPCLSGGPPTPFPRR